ncbi:DUF6541 family protein [Propionibacterium ruminifibrarum]|nr:DUF6541 family protein [Propionibacterium ruminifibrarum]
MKWIGLIPLTAVMVLWLIAPGYIIGRCARLSRVHALGAAAPVSVFTISVAAILADRVGLAWGPIPVLILTATLAVILLLVFGGHDYVKKHRPQSPSDCTTNQTTASHTPSRAALTDSSSREKVLPRPLLWVLTFTGATALTLINLMILLGQPRNFSQTFDNVFHLNAVRWILDHLNGSALTVSMTSGDQAPSFYPMAWHDTISLGLLTLHSSDVTAGTNAAILSIGAVVWILGCLCLVNAAFRCSSLGIVAAGFISAGFPSFPFDPISFGVLYPNFLGIALLPGTMVITLQTLGLGTRRVPSVRGIVLCIFAIGGVALAHPNSFLSYCLVLLPIMLIWALKLATQGWNEKSRPTTWAPSVLFLVTLVGVVKLWPVLQPTAYQDAWPPVQSTAQAIGEALLAAPLGAAPAWIIGVLAMVGSVRVIVTRQHVWMIACHVVMIFFWIVISSWELNPQRTSLVGGFYSDPHRIADTLPVTTLPLAALGASWLGAGLSAWVKKMWLARKHQNTTWIDPVLIIIEVLALLYFTQYSGTVRQAVGRGIITYQATSNAPLVDSDELALIEKLPDLVPAGSVIAVTPYNGASMTYALQGLATTTTHISYDWTHDQTIINEHLDEAATDSEVCTALKDLNVNYALDFGPVEINGGTRSTEYPGFDSLATSPGFEIVDREGHAVLYRITACD